MADNGYMDDLCSRAPVLGVGARGAGVVSALPVWGCSIPVIVTDELIDLSEHRAEVSVRLDIAQLALPGLEDDHSSLEKILDMYLVGQPHGFVVGALGGTTDFEIIVALSRYARDRLGNVVGIFSMPLPFEGPEVRARAASQVAELKEKLELPFVLPARHLFRSWNHRDLETAVLRLEETMRLVVRDLKALETEGTWHVCQIDGSSELDECPCALSGLGLIGLGKSVGMDPDILLSAMESPWLGGADVAAAEQLAVASRYGPNRSVPFFEILDADSSVESGGRGGHDEVPSRRTPPILFAVGFEDLSFLDGGF